MFIEFEREERLAVSAPSYFFQVQTPLRKYLLGNVLEGSIFDILYHMPSHFSSYFWGRLIAKCVYALQRLVPQILELLVESLAQQVLL